MAVAHAGLAATRAGTSLNSRPSGMRPPTPMRRSSDADSTCHSPGGPPTTIGSMRTSSNS